MSSVLLALVLGTASTASAQGVGSLALSSHARERVEAHGVVGHITAGQSGWLTVEIDGRAVFDVLAARADVPFATGDTIDVRVDCTHGGFHYVCSGVIRDAAGALLVAVAGSGEQLVPEWNVIGPARGTAHQSGDSVDEGLVLEHAGTRVTTRANGLSRRARTSDGAWHVSGFAHRHVGAGPRMPESVDYSQYAISRAPRRP